MDFSLLTRGLSIGFAIAAFGLTAVSGFLVNQQVWLRLGGGAFLCYLGLMALLIRRAHSVVSTGEN